MAWNEPGNKNNDPWKNRGGKDQGPPDLDDMLKDIFGKFGKMGGKGGGGNSAGVGGLGFGLITAALVVVWIISGFYTIKEAERGVVLRFGEYVEGVEPGLRWKPTFIDKVFPVNVQSIRSLPASGFMLTQDENVVRVEMEIQYQVTDPYNYLFSVTQPDESLRHALDSALRYVVGHSVMDDVLTSGKEVVRQNVWQEVEKIIEPYKLGLIVRDLNFKDARPPEEVKDAFDDAISAQEDEERFVREAEAYAREIEPRARGQVRRMEQEANAYKERVTLEAQGEVARFEKLVPEYIAAPEVTRQRLYLETMEEMYSNTTKVMIDVKDGGNMMYLPLDKIMQSQGSNATPLKRNDINSIRTPETAGQPSTDSNIRQNRFRSSGRN